MKKIVFMMPFYAFPVPSTMGGGIEELMTLLLNENEKQENSEYKFYFVTKQLYGKNKKYISNEKYKNTEIVQIKYNRFFNTITRAFNRFLKLLKINKRFTNNYYKKSFKVIKKIDPDTIIFEGAYDSDIEKYKNYFGKDKLNFHVHIQVLEKEDLTKYFNSTITVSQFIADDWKNYLQNPSMDLHTLSNCVNEDRFNKTISIEERETIRNSFGFKNDDFVVIYCGRINSEKGIDRLISSILTLPKNIKLLIVGSVNAANKAKSPFLSQIVDITNKNSEQIKFTGYIPNDQLYKIYQSADIQVVPSVWEEAAGLVVIEGQYSGLPQIITQSGGMVEFASKKGTIIVEKENNLEQNLANAILELYNNPKKREDMSKASKEDCLKHTKQKYYENFIEIAKKITEEK